MTRLHTPNPNNLSKIEPIINPIFVSCFALLGIMFPFKGVAGTNSEEAVDANTDELSSSSEQTQTPSRKTNQGESAAELPNSLPVTSVSEPELIHDSYSELRLTSRSQEAALSPEGNTTSSPPELELGEIGETRELGETGETEELESEGEDEGVAPSSTESEPTPVTEDPDYLIPPRIAPEDQVEPSTTTVPLNDTPINHLTEWDFSASGTVAETIDSNPVFSGTLKLDSQITESLTRTNIYTVDQQGRYFQLRTIPLEREVTTTTTEPQTLTGLQLQMSLTGACLFESAITEQQCTYTPGLVIDRDSIDPQFLVPTRIFQTSQVGDIVTPESFAAIQLPGFQRGANGQEIGVDLYFPNVGGFPGNSQSQQTQIEREEEIDYTIAGTISQVRQIVKANDTEAVLGRTIRGITILGTDQNRLTNTALQLGAQILPDVVPELSGSSNPVNNNINRNLFLAANNTRLPTSSFTIYSAGIGRAASLTDDITQLSEIPSANYNSLWLGLSPVIERSFSTGQVFYRPLSEPRLLSSSGAEGGSQSNVELLSVVNNQSFSTANLQNFYAQIYLDFFTQDVDYISESIYRESTSYFPHLSFTGNVTNSQDVIRYYAGVIASEEVKAYAGADYTRNTPSGWNFQAGGVGYLNPDRDYYSQLWGSVSKKLSLGQDADLILASGLNYALDRETQIGDVVSISPASTLTASARLNWGGVSFGLTNYFGGILPNSYENKLLADLTVNLTNNLRLSAYFAPIDQNTSRSPYGASLLWQLGDGNDSPTFAVNWQNQEYDYGSDPFGNNLSVQDNIFTVQFRW